MAVPNRDYAAELGLGTPAEELSRQAAGLGIDGLLAAMEPEHLLLPPLAHPRLYLIHYPLEFLDEETLRSSLSIRDGKRAIVPESLALGG